jgi:hypothetical protein
MSYDDDIRIPWGKVILIALVVIVVGFGLDWVATGNDFFLYKYFAPKYAVAQRQVFEGTPSFNKGQIQELENMEFTYIHEKDPDSKAALASIILHRSSGYNLNDPDVSADLRAFINGLKEKQGQPNDLK